MNPRTNRVSNHLYFGFSRSLLASMFIFITTVLTASMFPLASSHAHLGLFTLVLSTIDATPVLSPLTYSFLIPSFLVTPSKYSHFLNTHVLCSIVLQLLNKNIIPEYNILINTIGVEFVRLKDLSYIICCSSYMQFSQTCKLNDHNIHSHR